jgi:hypothetical protein
MDISWVINLKEEHKGFLTGFVPRKNEVFRRLPPEFLQGYCHGRSATSKVKFTLENPPFMDPSTKKWRLNAVQMECCFLYSSLQLHGCIAIHTWSYIYRKYVIDYDIYVYI